MSDVANAQKVPSITYQQLTARFATEDHARVNKGGGDQTYVPAEKIISRLNDVLGVAGWSFTVLREGFTESEAWVLGEITATIDGTEVRRQQYGDQALTVGRGEREKAVSDLMKKAGTNALKKCATLLGVALYLYDEDERHEVEAAMREASRPQPRQQPAQQGKTIDPTPMHDAERAAVITGANPPTPIDPARRELEAAYATGRKYAESIELQPENLDISALTNEDLSEVVEALRTQCRYVLAERKKQAS